jgi:hypothetical protein
MQRRPSCRVASAQRAKMAAALRAHMSLDFFDYQATGAAQLHG